MIKLLKIGLLLFAAFNLQAMKTQRILGEIVKEFDRENMRSIRSRDDIREGEIVAIYYRSRRSPAEWRYAQITSYYRNGYHFGGLVSFYPENVLNGFAVNFDGDVRKLPDLENKSDPAQNEQRSASQRLCDLLQLFHCASFDRLRTGSARATNSSE